MQNKGTSTLASYLAFSLLFSLVPVSATALQVDHSASTAQTSIALFADDTYERICLSQGWIECAEWRILDQSGVQKNRVIGPYPESALRQICGSNLCGGGVGGTVELVRIIPKDIVPVTDYGPGPKSSDTSSSESAPESSAPVEQTPRLGGYAVVHPETRHVCGVIVATIPLVMSSPYMGCPAGSQTYFQTRPSETGNVAGYHGKDVTYYDGTFYLSWGSIVDGIATDRNGRVWDTGTGQVLSEGSTPPSTPGSSSHSSSVSPAPTDSQVVSSSPQTSSAEQTSSSPSTSGSESELISPTLAEENSASQEDEASSELTASIGKSVFGSFLGRWAVRFENLAGSTISIRAGGNWYKFTLTSDSQLFSRRSMLGSEVRLRVWIDGTLFAESSVVVR